MACENGVKKDPTDIDSINDLREAAKNATDALRSARDEQRCENSIILICDRVLQAGFLYFEKVYKSLFEQIENDPKDGEIGVPLLKKEIVALREQLKGTEAPVQQFSDPIDIFVEAVKMKARVTEIAQTTVEKIHKECKSKVKLMEGKSESTVNVKGTMRILEKALLRRDDPGNANLVRDPIRFMRLR